MPDNPQYPYADFPAYRFVRIGLNANQIAGLAAQWAAMTPDAQNVQGRLIESVADAQVAVIAAGFPAALPVYLTAIAGPTAPAAPNVNDLWYNVTFDVWQRWNGTTWIASGGSANVLGSAANPITDPAAARPSGLTVVYWLTATQPTNLAIGDVWESTT